MFWLTSTEACQNDKGAILCFDFSSSHSSYCLPPDRDLVRIVAPHEMPTTPRLRRHSIPFSKIPQIRTIGIENARIPQKERQKTLKSNCMSWKAKQLLHRLEYLSGKCVLESGEQSPQDLQRTTQIAHRISSHIEKHTKSSISPSPAPESLQPALPPAEIFLCRLALLLKTASQPSYSLSPQ